MKKQTSRSFKSVQFYTDSDFVIVDQPIFSSIYVPTYERKAWLKVNLRIKGHEHLVSPVVLSVEGCDQPYTVECPANGEVNDFRAVSVQADFSTIPTFSLSYSWTTERDVAVPEDFVEVELWVETDGAHHFRIDRDDRGPAICLADDDL